MEDISDSRRVYPLLNQTRPRHASKTCVYRVAINRRQKAPIIYQTEDLRKESCSWAKAMRSACGAVKIIVSCEATYAIYDRNPLHRVYLWATKRSRVTAPYICEGFVAGKPTRECFYQIGPSVTNGRLSPTYHSSHLLTLQLLALLH
jgi:hypothetical protein